ncbi:MAG: GNAT family N-acetyltransferase [Bacteroidetes bacterium]|nr:GNAT family N-acetyltransferase [Bacteroidota bacterium]
MIRTLRTKDLELIHKWNQSTVPKVNSLTFEEFRLQSVNCTYSYIQCSTDSMPVGFIFLYDEKTEYDSLNYLYFKSRYQKFLYVDRIIIAGEHQKKGYGQQLYDFVIDTHNPDIFCCEVNITPPNRQSLSFHQKYGFNEIGQQNVYNKVVSLLTYSK